VISRNEERKERRKRKWKNNKREYIGKKYRRMEGVSKKSSSKGFDEKKVLIGKSI